MAKSNLVIVESPAKAKTIGKYLGPDYKVLASMGHVRDLPKSKMGVDLEHNDFEPDYQPIKGKEETIAELQEAADKSKKVYLATDPDREGEAISWHLKELLHLPHLLMCCERGRQTCSRTAYPHASDLSISPCRLPSCGQA